MDSGTPAPLIRRLTINRFRGIRELVWHPAHGVNVILGGGDVGKTTVLDEPWVQQQERNKMTWLEDQLLGVRFLFQGRDTKFSAAFRRLFKGDGIRWQ